MSWLRAFVEFEDSAEALAERLSLTGLAVETIDRPGAAIDGVVVAEVRSVDRHPDADKLQLVKAYDGRTERDIVCGASNYVVGDRVPLAVPGASLPGGFAIEARTVRGERSDGMLCSARELGLGADHAGILILDADAKPGADLVETLDLDDEVLEIDVLPNRPDALSILGVARETAALFGLRLRVPQLELDESDEAADEVATVEVVDADGCPRYTARILRGATRTGRSPWWLRRRLILAGMRPIDPIVDATNHQMLEIGQPLHAFDLATIRESTIRVRAAHAGERLVTLDGQDRELAEGDLLICDADRPIALAGIMGGADTEVSDSTTDILLESATFAASRVARTARRLDVRSEAAQRFERGVDPALAEVANARCAALIASLTGARVARGVAAGGPGAPEPPRILVTGSRISALVGATIEASVAAQALTAIGADVEASGDALAVTPPTWRPDITIPEDVVEEVARLYGYDRIPETLPAGGRSGGLSPRQRARRAILDAARGAGCDEAVTLSLLAPGVPDRLGLASDHPWRRTAALANPLSEDESRLRASLLPGLLDAARRNVAHRARSVALVEIGVVFAPQGEAVVEAERVAAVLTGAAATGWHAGERSLDVFDARGVLDAIAGTLGVSLEIEQVEEPPQPWHPGRTARVRREGNEIGFVGELHPSVADALSIPGRVAMLDLDVDALIRDVAVPAAPTLGRFPAVGRDLALEVPVEVPSAEVAATIARAGGTLVESVRLFDRYVGEQVAVGKVSLAFELRLQSPDRTLTDDDAAQVMDRIAEEARAHGWTIRG